ncbi:MAG: peptidylprolyl isomerase [Ignavibacteriales bacterium]|nr:peptidylprolyl isomerase [Ignavibacteriales bacterium]MCB9219084.1 peptidylprolyl isomerase [Ignavibacteriales bacterium]MCB9259666.1 peptidylprolyl isomerase [Ignavibacteriales bacterium]
MRSLAPWFIIAVGGLFVLFMVLSDSKLTDVIANRSNYVGSINGQEISYQEFSNLVEQYRKNQVAQTGQEIPESQMDAFRDQVWDNLVSQKLISAKIKDLGIVVTDEEIVSTITGPNPPQIITQYFVDSTGQFNRAAYDQAILDPQNKEAMLQTEELVRQQLIQQKLTSFLNASVVVSDAEVKRKFVEQNVKMSADYVLVDANTMNDSSITVSDNDIKEYYNANTEEFKIDAQRKLKYVLFSIDPSKDDSAAIKNNLTAIVAKLKDDTSSFKTYVEIYSDKPYSVDTTTLSLLTGEASTLLTESKEGEIVGPALSNEGYVVYKLDKVLNSNETLSRASHILVKSGNDEGAAKTKIDEIYNELMNGADFETVAKEKSEDGSASRGGDLGWFGKGQMVKEFENASFNGKIGEIQKPIKTQFGYHIVKVTGRSNKKYVVEKIVNEIRASATTLDRAFNNASDFAYVADKNDFTSEAELMKYEIKETPAFKEETKVIPGLGTNNALLRFAFDSDVNDISSTFKVAAGYVVATVSEIIKEGVKPLEEVSANIKSKVLREKKLDKAYSIAEEIKTKASQVNDLSVAKEVYEKARINNAANFTANGTIPGIGRDFAFAQAALDAELNKIAGPVKASRGCYLLKVTQRTEIDSTMYSIQKNSLRDNLMNQKRNSVFTDWIASLKDKADIEDNRHQFYR